jgi:hypothetical protein
MKYTTVHSQIEQKLGVQNAPISVSKISIFVYLLDIIIIAGRHFPVISICLTGLNILLAVNDFLTNNIGFAILNSMFVIGGLFFFIQIRLTDKAHHVTAIPTEIDAI